MSQREAIGRRTGVFCPLRIWASLTALILLSLICPKRIYAEQFPQICDEKADFALGTEDYSTAIRLHENIVRNHPGDALAHYHLGFAYGMSGDHSAELREYLAARQLGLRNWDFLLNLGLLYLDRDAPSDAIAVLQEAAGVRPQHAEVHFNLALAFERSGQSRRAIGEMLQSLKLDPTNPDSQNELAALYAETGNPSAARAIWAELLLTHPNYEPAQKNLAILQTVANSDLPPVVLSAKSSH